MVSMMLSLRHADSDIPQYPSIKLSVSRPLASMPKNRGESPKPCCSRKSSSRCTVALDGRNARLTVFPTRTTAPLVLPPVRGISFSTIAADSVVFDRLI